MKTLGKIAIVLAILFFVFIIPAGILIALGAKQAASDEEVQQTIHNIFDNMDDYGTIHIGSDDADSIDFSGSYTPAGDISGIVLENAAFEVEIDRGGENEFIVEHTGDYPASLISKYSIEDGAEYAEDESFAGESPFFFKEENGILTFGLETDYNFNGFSISSVGSKSLNCGTLKVYLPASYKGDFTINYSAGEIEISDLELSGLSITGAAGEFTANNCKVGKLTINGIAGQVDYNGEIGAMDLSGGMGDYNIELTAPITGDSRISGTLGQVEITVPEGTKLNVNSAGNLGEVSIDSELRDANGAKFDINGNMGQFTIEID